MVATVHALTAEFKVLKYWNGQMVITDFVDLGPSGVVMVALTQALVYFWHVDDLQNIEGMIQVHTQSCLGTAVFPQRN